MKNTFAEKYINNETKRIEKRPSLMRRIKNKATDAVNRVKKSAKGPCLKSKIWRFNFTTNAYISKFFTILYGFNEIRNAQNEALSGF